jgi:hypothetical protein
MLFPVAKNRALIAPLSMSIIIEDESHLRRKVVRGPEAGFQVP